MSPRAHTRRVFGALVLVGACVLAAVASAPAASGGSVVGAFVPSATELDIDQCLTNTPATNIGNILPGASATTPAPCVVEFGSSNDTSALRISQADGSGAGMWRLPHGYPDTTFGGGDGISDAAADVTPPGWARYSSWAELPDDTMYAAGPHGTNGRIYRFTPSGTLDSGWNGTGLVTFTPTEDLVVIDTVADDHLFVAGRSNLSNLIVGRYETDGTFDTSCDTDGWNQFAFPAGTVGTHPTTVTWDPVSGRTYVGLVVDNGSDNDMGIAAITPDCTLDTTFSGDGYYVQDFGGYEATVRVIVDDDGDVFLVGDGVQTYTIRLASDGSPDLGYNGTGSRVFDIGPFGESAGYAVNDGSRILVAVGANECVCDSSSAIFAVRDDGTYDPAYGTGGIFRVDAHPTGDESAGGLTIDSAGNAVFLGTFDDGTGVGGYGMRVRPDGTLDTTLGTNGVVIGNYSGAATSGYVHVHEGIDGRYYVGMRRDMGGGVDRQIIERFATTPVDQYLDDTRDWLTPGTGHFGVCLSATTGTAAWTANAACTLGSDPWWRALPATASTVATENTSGPQTATFRFGFRALLSQPPGTYVAPVTFEVVAPAS